LIKLCSYSITQEFPLLTTSQLMVGTAHEDGSDEE